MTIHPDLIKKTALAILTAEYHLDPEDTPDLWADQPDDVQDDYREQARTILGAVAADIWEQGYAACSHNRWLDESVYATEDDEEQNNPYIQETN